MVEIIEKKKGQAKIKVMPIKRSINIEKRKGKTGTSSCDKVKNKIKNEKFNSEEKK